MLIQKLTVHVQLFVSVLLLLLCYVDRTVACPMW